MKRNGLGSIVRLKRLSKGLTQEQLIQRIHGESGLLFNSSHYSDIECGRVLPRIETLEVIIKPLEIEFEEIKETYLTNVDDRKALDELVTKHSLTGDFSFAGRVVSKLIKLVKNEYATDSKRLPRLTHKVYFLLCLAYQMNSRHLDKMVRYIAGNLRAMTKKQSSQIIERMFEFSKANELYEPFVDVIGPIIDDLNYRKNEMFTCLYQIAKAYCHSNRPVESIMEAVKANKLIEEATVDINMKGSLLWTMGLCYYQLQMYGEARDIFITTLTYCKGHSLDVDLCYHYIGLASFFLGDYQTARQYWKLPLSRLPSNDHHRLRVLNTLCHMELRFGDKEQGIELLEELSRWFDSTQTKTECKICLAYYYWNKALLFMEQHEFKPALDLLLIAMKIFDATPVKGDIQKSNHMVIYHDFLYVLANDSASRAVGIMNNEQIEWLSQIRELHEIWGPALNQAMFKHREPIAFGISRVSE
jgi:tetratricopeptide (TPR) repeat protein